MYNPVTNDWTWVGGAFAGAGATVYGTQSVPAAANNPGARYDAVGWTDNSGNLWLFGGVFSYSNTVNNFSDLWELNPTTGLWTWVGGADTANQPGVYGTQGVPAPGNVPGARSVTASWTDKNGNFWLFGGGGYDAAGVDGSLNDLWELNPTNLKWTWVSGGSTIPVSAAPGVYGVRGMPSQVNVPGLRSLAAGWTDKNGGLWLFGGIGNDSTTTGGGYLNDLWEFRQFTGTLSSITVTPSNTAILFGATQQFTATGTYSDGSTQNLTGTVGWTSSNTSVATISSTGVATSLSAGSTYISASLNGVNSNISALDVVSGAYTAPTEPVGTASGTQTALVVFSSSFTLGSISVVTQGAPNLDFRFASGGACNVGTPYSAGQVCTVNYTFTPLAPGQRMGAIVITDSSGNVQATTFISGIGTGPQAVFSPGIISTVAGNGIQGNNGDGIAAISRRSMSTNNAMPAKASIEIFGAGSSRTLRKQTDSAPRP